MVAQTCVVVRWQWITFPAVLVALGFCFLVSIVAATRLQRWKDGVGKNVEVRGGPLKSTPLPLMFYGLHRDTVDMAGHIAKPTQMNKVAEGIRVELRRSWVDDKWGFVKAENPPQDMRECDM